MTGPHIQRTMNKCLLLLLFPDGSDSKICACNVGIWVSPWIGKIPWRRGRQPTPVFLPGESYGQRSLAGCSPQGHTESDTTEKRLSTQDKTVATETGPVGKYLLRQLCLILRRTEIQIPSIYVEICQRSPRILQWIAYPFSSGSSQPRN